MLPVKLIFFISVEDEDGSQKCRETQVKTKASCSCFIESIKRIFFFYLFLSLLLLLVSSLFNIFHPLTP